jgi:hypothetical protein
MPTKFFYYVQEALRAAVPTPVYRARREGLLHAAHALGPSAQERVDYYCKLTEPFDLGAAGTTVADFDPRPATVYHIDLVRYLRYFDRENRFAYVFGDIDRVPEVPSFLKARPIGAANRNAVLMKFNHVRHFRFVRDRVPFEEKEDRAIWRGQAHVPRRVRFLETWFGHPLVDAGQIEPNPEHPEWVVPKATRPEQLRCKFQVSIEGIDVATNLVWIMGSNALAFAPRPRFETWFMEGRLIPGHHYVQIRDDYTDLVDKIEYYRVHTDEALAIVRNAQAWVRQFLDPRVEHLISLMVAARYFGLSRPV